MADRHGQAPPGTVLRSSWGKAARRFAQTVIEVRRRRQMSTFALAEQCSVPQRVILGIERACPVEPQALAAIARNLDLPLPDLEADPVYRLGLLLHQRRRRARLSLTQLASLSDLSIHTIIRVERGQSWPWPRTCDALLSVSALELCAEDFAEFTRPMPASDPRDRPAAPALDPATEPSAPAPRAATRQLAFTVRVYTDGSILFRPSRPLSP